MRALLSLLKCAPIGQVVIVVAHCTCTSPTQNAMPQNVGFQLRQIATEIGDGDIEPRRYPLIFDYQGVELLQNYQTRLLHRQSIAPYQAVLALALRQQCLAAAMFQTAQLFSRSIRAKNNSIVSIQASQVWISPETCFNVSHVDAAGIGVNPWQGYMNISLFTKGDVCVLGVHDFNHLSLLRNAHLSVLKP